MTPPLDRLLPRDAIAAFCAKWGVAEVYVFGSASRGALRDLEVEAEVPSGAPENVVRTVSENARTAKFTHQAFERD